MLRFVTVSFMSLLLLAGCRPMSSQRAPASDTTAPGRDEVEARPYEVDHLLIYVRPEAARPDSPERRRLESAGLRPLNQPARHADVGTASLGYLFENAYLELVWIEDENLARSAAPDLIARTIRAGTLWSPFGVGLRGTAGRATPPPFAARRYHADWMKPGDSIWIAEDGAGGRGPKVFVVPPAMAMPSWIGSLRRKGFVNSLRLSGVRIESPVSTAEVARQVEACSGVTISAAPESTMTLTIESGAIETADLRPDLPLLLHRAAPGDSTTALPR